MRRTPRSQLRHIEEFVVLLPIKLSSSSSLKIGDKIKKGDFDLRRVIRWSRSRHIEPVGTRYANYMLEKYDRMASGGGEQKEEKIIATDKKNTRRDDLIEIAREIDGFTVDGRWNDDRLEQEIDLFMSSQSG